MSNEPRKKHQLLVVTAFIALLFGAVGLVLAFFKVVIFADLVQLLLFIVAAKIAYEITKDGKPFFQSFYKIAYLASIIIFSIFLILPWIIKFIEFVK